MEEIHKSTHGTKNYELTIFLDKETGDLLWEISHALLGWTIQGETLEHASIQLFPESNALKRLKWVFYIIEVLRPKLEKIYNKKEKPNPEEIKQFERPPRKTNRLKVTPENLAKVADKISTKNMERFKEIANNQK